MKKKDQEKGLRKLQLHRETLHTLLYGGTDRSVTCITCPGETTVSAGCAGCVG